jgi:RNA polymerase sigma factor (sigma-70 family)
MPGTTHALTDQLAGLFSAGSCAGMSDGELLQRFRTSRDEVGERAFEALVTRHGPMVLAICRNMLNDPGDVHDAFQAVFLVLARRAGAIRKSDSVGSWLYGVTVRVAARARATAIRRRIRERRTLAAASAAAVAGGSPESNGETSIEYDEGAAVVHEEVVRLPERYRTPVVLCYFEGLTHDEAAARLSWPVGTVRSRLARARDQLRTRLTRRGVTAPSTIGPLAPWLISGELPSTPTAAIRAASASLSLPVPAPSLARAAVRVAAGQSATAGSWSAASITLANGVLRTMMLQKLTVVAFVLVSVGIGTGTGAVLINGSSAQEPPGSPGVPAKQAVRPAAGAEAPKPSEIDPLLVELVEAARRRVAIQKNSYEFGRSSFVSLAQALAELGRVESLAAKTDDERSAMRRRQLDLLKAVEDHAKAAQMAGRGTAADVEEAHQGRLEAEYNMKVQAKEDAEKAALLRRVAELERRVERLEKGGRGGGR